MAVDSSITYFLHKKNIIKEVNNTRKELVMVRWLIYINVVAGLSMANRKELTADELRQLADKIRFVAKTFGSVADEMDNRKLQSLSIKGIDTLQKVLIPRLNGSLASAMRAIAEADASDESTAL